MPSSFVTPQTVALPGSSIHRISQARILEWVAISFSNTEDNIVLSYSVQREIMDDRIRHLSTLNPILDIQFLQ